MQFTIATLLDTAINALQVIDRKEDQDQFNQWIVDYPA
jgi:hypothetical protein